MVLDLKELEETGNKYELVKFFKRSIVRMIFRRKNNENSFGDLNEEEETTPPDRYITLTYFYN